jgi:hypothetical protein
MQISTHLQRSTTWILELLSIPTDDALLLCLEEFGGKRGIAECCACVGIGGFFITRLV